MYRLLKIMITQRKLVISAAEPLIFDNPITSLFNQVVSAIALPWGN
jgi:hypothetical protein